MAATNNIQRHLPSVLLQIPPLDVSRPYLQQIARDVSNDNVRVQDAGSGKGKGIFASKEFSEGDVIFRECPLVAMQHNESSKETTVCAHSHVFVGSVEQLIAKSLVNVIESAAALAAQGDHDKARDSDDEDGVEDEEAEELQQRMELINQHVSTAEIEQLQTGALKLPLSERMQLPEPIPCRGGCHALYSSAAAEEAAWQQQHCLLCPGTPAAAPTAGPSSSSGAGGSSTRSAASHHHPPHNPCGSGSAAAGSSHTGSATLDCQYGLEVDRASLGMFYDHAARTNDIFVLVAKAVAMTALRAMHILQGHQPMQQQQQQHLGVRQEVQQGGSSAVSGSAGAPGSVSAGYVEWGLSQLKGSLQGDHGTSTSLPSSSSTAACTPGMAEAALLEAWMPLSMGWKRLWWESVAVPEDVEDEQAFRQQLKELTAESLELMKPAWPGVAALFPALMSMEVWGGLVGMFELNNLAMAVPSPVEDYFLLVDGLPEPEKAACQQSTQKWLDALDKWYDVPAQGTGFMALQSCANHSCEPNAATEGEGTGLTAVYARRAIKEGEEITITYIEEDGDEDGTGKALSFKQRQAALRDYGFKCQCTLCLRDAAKAPKKPSRSGVKTGRR
uniref:SET domain-containing protein n=1 Tax=Dunaliella tertiolecta TaxID=3047 RepID=A0A7S3VR10_DUNTE|mmetsp:Transcript_13031/g.35470  ORF Transcript_13031/g.35470 Transcript_13031/m.35470 type:complete len:615 (+) Transcript_13031:73-1917(+)